jgi:hypothetical protein
VPAGGFLTPARRGHASDVSPDPWGIKMEIVVGLAILGGIIWFAFGAKTARAFVGAVLIIGALAFLYVMYRIVNGTI